eukprot:754833-Amphidinium_carterae.1
MFAKPSIGLVCTFATSPAFPFALILVFVGLLRSLSRRLATQQLSKILELLHDSRRLLRTP